MLKRLNIAKRFIFHGSKSILVPKMICRPPNYHKLWPQNCRKFVFFYALYVCTICMYHMYVLYLSYLCIICMYYMYVLHVCIICMHYMYLLYALYVCIICIICICYMHYMFVLYVCIICIYYMYLLFVFIFCIFFSTTAKGSRTGAVLEPFLVSDFDDLIARPFWASLICFIWKAARGAIGSS